MSGKLTCKGAAFDESVDVEAVVFVEAARDRFFEKPVGIKLTIKLKANNRLAACFLACLLACFC